MSCFSGSDGSCLKSRVEVRSFIFLAVSASWSLFFLFECFANAVFYKTFSPNLFRESLGINLSTGRNTGRGKVAYSWISPDPAAAGPTLGGIVVVVVVVV